MIAIPRMERWWQIWQNPDIHWGMFGWLSDRALGLGWVGLGWVGRENTNTNNWNAPVNPTRSHVFAIAQPTFDHLHHGSLQSMSLPHEVLRAMGCFAHVAERDGRLQVVTYGLFRVGIARSRSQVVHVCRMVAFAKWRYHMEGRRCEFAWESEDERMKAILMWEYERDEIWKGLSSESIQPSTSYWCAPESKMNLPALHERICPQSHNKTQKNDNTATWWSYFVSCVCIGKLKMYESNSQWFNGSMVHVNKHAKSTIKAMLGHSIAIQSTWRKHFAWLQHHCCK